MLKYYPFANNRNKQSTPSNLKTIEAYSQASYHKKPNLHKRNASDIITSQIAQPRASIDLMRRGSLFDQEDFENKSAIISTKNISCLSLLENKLSDDAKARHSNKTLNVLSNITNGIKMRNESTATKQFQKISPTPAKFIDLSSTFKKTKKRIQLQTTEDSQNSQSIISDVNTPSFNNVGKSSHDINRSLKILTGGDLKKSTEHAFQNSFNSSIETKHKENKPPSSLKRKTHVRNNSSCLENERRYIIPENENKTPKSTLHLKKNSSCAFQETKPQNKSSYAEIIKQKKKGKSSLQELIEKQLQQKVLQQRLSEKPSDPFPLEKTLEATPKTGIHNKQTIHKKFQQYFKKQLKTENTETPKMLIKMVHSVPTEQNIINDRSNSKSPLISHNYTKKRNNSITISHDLETSFKNQQQAKTKKPGHKKNSHSLNISNPNKFSNKNSPLEKTNDLSSQPHASFATDYSENRQSPPTYIKLEEGSQTATTEEFDQNDAYMREKLIKINKECFDNCSMSPGTSLDYYRLVKALGKGSFGIVYLGIHLLTGQYVAIKSIEKRHMQDEHSKRKVLQEISIIKNLNHANIVKLLEVFENNKYIFLVLEHASKGDLLGFVKQTGRLKEATAKNIFSQIIAGVKHCHQHGVLHRDIKLDNILLDKNFNVKICDFGVSRLMKEGQLINEQCGTPAYIAPEIISNKGYKNYSSDIWSLGIVLFAMLTGTVPFKAFNIEDLNKAIFSGKFSCPNYLSPECQNLIHSMLKLDPSGRISLDQIISHKWFTSKTQFYSRGDQEQNQIVDTVVKKVEALGYNREYIIKSLKNNGCNHASTCYFLIHKKYSELML